MKCFYHSADLDGICSAAVVLRRYPDCACRPIDYGDEFPWHDIANDEPVIMTDFSLKAEDMARLAEEADLTWIDHHHTAVTDVESLGLSVAGLRREGTAACVLTWEYLFPETPAPRAVELLGRYDVWEHDDPDVMPFQYGMLTTDHQRPGADIWKSVFSGDKEFLDRMIETGRKVLQFRKHENERYAEACAFETEFNGLRAIALNRAMTDSYAFATVWDPEQYDIMITFSFRKKYWAITIYSEGDRINVGEIATSFGGGGHRNAAGFQCMKLPFNLPHQ